MSAPYVYPGLYAQPGASAEAVLVGISVAAMGTSVDAEVGEQLAAANCFISLGERFMVWATLADAIRLLDEEACPPLHRFGYDENGALGCWVIPPPERPDVPVVMHERELPDLGGDHDYAYVDRGRVTEVYVRRRFGVGLARSRWEGVL